MSEIQQNTFTEVNVNLHVSNNFLTQRTRNSKPCYTRCWCTCCVMRLYTWRNPLKTYCHTATLHVIVHCECCASSQIYLSTGNDSYPADTRNSICLERNGLNLPARLLQFQIRRRTAMKPFFLYSRRIAWNHYTQASKRKEVHEDKKVRFFRRMSVQDDSQRSHGHISRTCKFIMYNKKNTKIYLIISSALPIGRWNSTDPIVFFQNVYAANNISTSRVHTCNRDRVS